MAGSTPLPSVRCFHVVIFCRQRPRVQGSCISLVNSSASSPPNLLLKIKATATPLFANGKDRISWASSPSGEFELKEVYRLACSPAKILPKLAPLWVVGFGKLPLFPKSSAFFGNVFIEAVLEPRGLGPLNIFF